MNTRLARLWARQLPPGTVMRHKNSAFVVLSHRKDDNTGWWNTDGSGLDDFVIDREDADWTVAALGEGTTP